MAWPPATHQDVQDEVGKLRVDVAAAYGVTAGDSVDYSTQLQSVSNALAAFGGGSIEMPAGVVVGRVSLGNAVTLNGQGKNASTLRRPAAWDGPVVQTTSFEAAVRSGTDGTIGDAGLRDITIDGNRAAGGFTTPIFGSPGVPTLGTAVGGTLVAAQYAYRVAAKTARGTGIAAARQFITTGSTGSVTLTWAAVAGATGYVIYGRTPYAERLLVEVGAVTTWTDNGTAVPVTNVNAENGNYTAPAAVALYGWRPVVRGVRIINAPGAGLHSVWPGGAPPVGDTMETAWSDLHIERAGVHSMIFDGPHDSTLSQGFFAMCGQAGTIVDNVVHERGPLRMFGCHMWGTSRWGLLGMGQLDMTGCQSEGANVGQVKVMANDCHINGLEVYFPGAAAGAGLVLGDSTYQPGDIVVDNVHAYAFDATHGAAIDFRYAGAGSRVTGVVRHGGVGSTPWLAPIQSAQLGITANLVCSDGTGLTLVGGALVVQAADRAATPALTVLGNDGSRAFQVTSNGAIGIGGDANQFIRMVLPPTLNDRHALVSYELAGQTVPIFKLQDAAFADKVWNLIGAADGFGVRGGLSIMGSATLTLAADITTTSTTIVNAAGLVTTDSLQPGTYTLDAYLIDQSSATTAGPRLGIGGTATATVTNFTVEQATSATARTTTIGTAMNTGYGTNPATANTPFGCTIHARVVVTAAGTLGLRWLMSAAGTGTLKAGSYVVLTRIA